MKGEKMSKNHINRRNKIKRTSSYRGYNHYKRYSASTGSQGTGLGKAVALSFAVVAATSLVIFCCSVYIPKLVDISKKNFINTESSAESSTISKVESSKPESKAESSKSETSKKENSKAESSKPETSQKEDTGYLDENVFIYKNIGYSSFKGSDESALKYANSLNAIASTLDSSVSIYSIIVPTHSTVSLDKLQKENNANEKANLQIISNNLSERIKLIDVENALKNKKNEYIYYNTDENWTSLGAYYAYKEFCENAGLTATDFSGVEKKKIEGFFGGLISSTKTDKNKKGNADLLKNSDTVAYYNFGNNYQCGIWKTKNSGEETVSFINNSVSAKNARDIFCYGDVSLFKINTGKSTGKRLCIVKDSYGSELAPYFMENYDEVHIIDARLFEGSLTGYCYNHSITDVLFINGINTANEKEQISALSDMA